MALKPDRVEHLTDLSFFMNETGERGVIVTHSTAGSGAAMDDSNAAVIVATGGSGDLPAGLLLNDVVNLDLTRQHINWHKAEVQKGGKVSVLKKGYVVTNYIAGTPTAGVAAFVDDGTDGYIATDAEVTDGKKIIIGRFMSTKDEDGYAKVEVNLPMPFQNTDDDTVGLE